MILCDVILELFGLFLGSEESFVTRMRSGQTKTPSRDTSPDSVRTLSTVDEQGNYINIHQNLPSTDT